MICIGYILCIFYLWLGYKIFNDKTYGSYIYQFIIVLTSLSLYYSVFKYILTKNIYYLVIPLIMFILYFYIDNKLKKKNKYILSR
jgi:hypothetical protein